MAQPSRRFLENNGDALALAFLKRSDDAALAYRGFVFLAAAGGLGFVMRHDSGLKESPHIAAAFFFVVSAGMVLFSWWLQKDKALKRYKALVEHQTPAGAFDAYRKVEEPFEGKGFRQGNWMRRNEFWDSLATSVLVLAIFSLVLPIIASRGHEAPTVTGASASQPVVQDSFDTDSMPDSARPWYPIP